MNDDHPMNDKTLNSRPLPRRSRWGWGAWESTVGYLASKHSPDASLKLQVGVIEGKVTFSATVAWGEFRESVENTPDSSTALKDLWDVIDRSHSIFLHVDDKFRSPVGYEHDEWLDDVTNDILARLLLILQQLFADDWMLLIVYRPVEAADKRQQIRLVADNSQIQRIVQGSSLADVCRKLLYQAVIIMSDKQN